MITDIFENLTKNSCKWNNYFEIHEKHLNKFVSKSPKVLEIGIFEGGSLEMWAKYFGEGTKVVGVDIDPKFLEHKYDYDVEIVIGDQGNPEFWNNFHTTHEGFDFILDDGGHTMDQQITTLEKCWPLLNEGGIIMIEDIHTSYHAHYGSEGPTNFVRYVGDNLIHMPMHQHWHRSQTDERICDIFRDLHSFTIYNGIVVFEKRKFVETFCLGVAPKAFR